MSCLWCGRPAVGVGATLSSGSKLICAQCLAEVDQIGVDAGRLDPAGLDALDQLNELTAEQEFEQALGAEVRWHLEGDGTLVRAEDDERRGRARGRDARRAWGQP
ncbi:MAG: hypothetical protein ACRDRK_05095 [Pseudonocardia sp.]